jgi:hypothetical protein
MNVYLLFLFLTVVQWGYLGYSIYQRKNNKECSFSDPARILVLGHSLDSGHKCVTETIRSIVSIPVIEKYLDERDTIVAEIKSELAKPGTLKITLVMPHDAGRFTGFKCRMYTEILNECGIKSLSAIITNTPSNYIANQEGFCYVPAEAQRSFDNCLANIKIHRALCLGKCEETGLFSAADQTALRQFISAIPTTCRGE